jgi:tRNA(Glu) U13 pseudouridine synthase TruD
LKKPNNLTWEKIRYTDPNADIVQPDEDALLGFEAPKSEESGEKLALRVEFDLDSASYATMALREVLKSETSNVNQRALTEAMMALEKVDKTDDTTMAVEGDRVVIATPDDGKVEAAISVE